MVNCILLIIRVYDHFHIPEVYAKDLRVNRSGTGMYPES
jgi:hypothetical protein